MNAENERQAMETDHQDDDRAAAGEATAKDQAERATTPLDMAKERITELEASLKAAAEQDLRAQAEFENYRKRVRREAEDEKKYASQRLVEDLLPVADDLTRALESAKGSEESIVAGVRMVLQRFRSSLERHHVREIEATGPFDPHRHEAVAQIPNDAPQGTILQVARTGYLLHDRVIRPAQVVVSAGKPG
jgi:molecular chaperone GrpE